MKTSLSRSIVKFFHNVVFSKKALLSLILISLFTANSSLYCMDATETPALTEAALATAATIAAPEVVVPVVVGVGTGVLLNTAAQALPMVEAPQSLLQGYAEAKALEDGADGSEEADDQTTQSSQVVQNPNPNISSNGGSISLAIPTDTTAVKDVNPVLDKAATDGKQDTSAKEKTKDKTKDKDKDVAQPKADTQQRSEDVVEQSTDTQKQQSDGQTQADAAAPSAEAAQLKAKETQASGNTQTGGKLDDPIEKKKEAEQQKESHESIFQHLKDLADGIRHPSTTAPTIAQQLKQLESTIAEAQKSLIGQAKTEEEKDATQLLLDAGNEFKRTHPQITFIPGDESPEALAKLNRYIEQEIYTIAKRLKQEQDQRIAKQKATFDKAVVNIPRDLVKIKDFVSTSDKLGAQLGDVHVPKDLAIKANYTFVGVTENGEDVYRSDVIHIRQRIRRGIWHTCEDRDYVVDIIVGDTENAEPKPLVRYLDQVNDSKLIKPLNPSSAPSTRDIQKVSVDTPVIPSQPADTSSTKSSAAAPATTTVDDAAETASYSRAKEKADPIIITIAAPSNPEPDPDPEDEEDKKLMEHIEGVVKRQQRHIFSEDHKNKGLDIVRKTEEETANAIIKKVYKLSKKGLVNANSITINL